MNEIPSSMAYAMKNSDSINAETTLRQFAANNGTTFSSAVSEIRINVSADGFLDGNKSYLYFTINNTNATAGDILTLDSSALCWVDSIRVESNGQVLERLDRAAVWDNLQARWKDGATQIQARNAKCGGPVLGGALLANDGDAIAGSASKTYACPLPLGFLNTHHGRAIPQGGNFDIVVRCNSQAGQCFKWTTTTQNDFTITNPRFYAPVYRVNDSEVMGEYSQAIMERGLTWSGDIVKTYVNSFPAGSGTRNLQINDRSRSLKALVSVARQDSEITTDTKNSVGASSLLALTQMRYVIGGKNYPQDQVQYDPTDGARLYEECQKALAPDGKTHCEPAVSGAAFNAIDATGQGVMAVSLKLFDDESLRMTGLDTASSAAPNTLELINGAAAVSSEVSTFAIAEAVFAMDGRGQMSVMV